MDRAEEAARRLALDRLNWIPGFPRRNLVSGIESCHPRSAVRELLLLRTSRYQISPLTRPIDRTPQTLAKSYSGTVPQ